MSKSSRNDSQWLRDGCPKNFKHLKYEIIIYHFKTRDLEINIDFFARYLNFNKIFCEKVLVFPTYLVHMKKR